MAVFKKQVNVHISSHIYNAANAPLKRTADKATSKNLKFSFVENRV